MNFAVLDVDRRPEVMAILRLLDEWGTVRYFSPDEEEAFIAWLPEVDVLLIRLYKVDETLLLKGRKLKAVIKAGVGVDHIDVEAATKMGIKVIISPGNHISVAESAVLLMLALSRHLITLNKNVHAAEHMHALGTEMYGKILGLVGFGRIGRHVARIAKGLGMKINVYDPYIDSSKINEIGITCIDFKNMLKYSDYISIHCPLTAGTRHLFSTEAFKLMKPSAFIINTARGAIIDEVALYQALKNCEIAGAGLDVFEQEPLQADNPLLELDNVIATPHRLIQTKESIMRQTQSMVDSAILLARGEPTPNAIN